MKVLLTGGAGYIGSTTARALEVAGHTPVVLDSLVTGPRAFVRDRIFFEGDVGDGELLRRVVREHPDIDAVIHLAARVVVPESVAKPQLYHRENLAKSIELFGAMADLGLRRLVFSSSAAVYASGGPDVVDEESPTAPTSPYARTKLMAEEVLRDLAGAGALASIALRYFNPIGSDPDLLSGVHIERPSHVLGQLLMTALGDQPRFTLTGTQFDTRDGSGLRDYVHVWDVARAHVAAVEKFDEAAAQGGGHTVLNVGTGRGVTVRELIDVVERVTGRPLEVTEAAARPGDSRGAYADVRRAAKVLGWSADLSVEDGVASAVAWMRHRASVLGGVSARDSLPRT